MPSTLCWASSCQQRLMELSGFLRRATTGVSSMPTACVQWKSSMRSRPTAPAETSGSIWAWSPTSTTAQFGIGGDGLHGAGHDRPGGVVAAHRVQRDSAWLTSLLFGRHDLTALVIAAIGTDAVRQHRLFAAAAILNLHRLEVLVAAPLALAGVGGSSLRNGHDVRLRFANPARPAPADRLRGKERYRRDAGGGRQGRRSLSDCHARRRRHSFADAAHDRPRATAWRGGADIATMNDKEDRAVKIILANPRGFCAGVNMAIESLERALDLFGTPLYVYHEIVHNRPVVERFRKRGVVFVDRHRRSAAEGRRCCTAPTAWPRPSARRRRNAACGAIDATCPLVTKVHLEAVRFAREGYTILLIGHEGHDEVLGTMGEAPDDIRLVQDAGEVGTARVAGRAPPWPT